MTIEVIVNSFVLCGFIDVKNDWKIEYLVLYTSHLKNLSFFIAMKVNMFMQPIWSIFIYVYHY